MKVTIAVNLRNLVTVAYFQKKDPKKKRLVKVAWLELKELINAL
jgi:hypothetical protein